MKKPRSLDHDGLDGIIPSTDKARLKSGNPQGKSDKTLKKPMHSNVPWLLGVIGSLALLAVFVPDLTQKPEAVTQTAALNNQATPVKSPASELLVAAENADTPAPQPPAEAAPTMVAEAKSDHALAANQNAQQSAAGDADIQTPDALPELPTEPTAAGIPKASPDTVAQTSVTTPFTVYFKFDSSKLTPESANSGNELLSAAKGCQKRIKLIGHTCNLGSDAANLQLGLARANAVKKLLIAKGIGSTAIFTASEGMRKPAAPNDTKEGQALNRRVELQCVDN
ncbi:OmpA family protein [Methylomonas sp. MK1]|uniref:OmpA family protein n=1 Tax=Methylomonas sp. MK1 TaxID=1131552 RepID=UPI0003647E25|nr:OmpA family protein [Methylomonas sp. MK1]